MMFGLFPGVSYFPFGFKREIGKLGRIILLVLPPSDKMIENTSMENTSFMTRRDIPVTIQ